VVVNELQVSDGAPQATTTSPFISVAIPTCNRPDDMDRCLSSLSRVRYPNWELIVVDQSDGEQTRTAVMAYESRVPRIVYLRLAEKNLSAARNLAIKNAGSKIVAFIDDDCTIEPDWLARISAAFDADPRAQLMFGSVVAGEHDQGAEYMTTWKVQRPKRFNGTLDALRVCGIGASMYLRLGPSAPESFDLFLGAGSRFRSAEDHDYALRLLAAGGTALHDPQIVVTHHGVQSFADGSASSRMRGYYYGTGACHAKLIRCGHWIMIAVVLDMLAKNIAEIRPLNALAGRPTHIARTLMYLRGVRDGFRVPVDRRRSLFTA
jgi:glycosyltransferase involved in cell wall biosynthesis